MKSSKMRQISRYRLTPCRCDSRRATSSRWAERAIVTPFSAQRTVDRSLEPQEEIRSFQLASAPCRRLTCEIAPVGAAPSRQRGGRRPKLVGRTRPKLVLARLARPPTIFCAMYLMVRWRPRTSAGRRLRGWRCIQWWILHQIGYGLHVHHYGRSDNGRGHFGWFGCSDSASTATIHGERHHPHTLLSTHALPTSTRAHPSNLEDTF